MAAEHAEFMRKIRKGLLRRIVNRKLALGFARWLRRLRSLK